MNEDIAKLYISEKEFLWTLDYDMSQNPFADKDFTNTEKLNRAYAEGVIACFNKTGNPYNAETQKALFLNWQRGFLEAPKHEL